MKKLLLIALTCALLLSTAACNSKDKAEKTTDTSASETVAVTNQDGAPVTDENGEQVYETVADTDSTDLSSDAPESESAAPDDSATMPEGEVIDPIIVTDDNIGEDGEPIPDGYVTYEDDEGNTVTEPVYSPDKEALENGAWPADIPADLPKYTAFTAMDDPYYENYETYELWTMGFTTTEEDYEAYLSLIESNGFVKSDEIYGIWGKGNIHIDIWPEAIDEDYWVSLDVYCCADPEVPAEFFAFETNHAIYEVEKNESEIIVYYECGTDFEGEATAYLETLSANGFTVSGNMASKNIGGVDYTCYIDTDTKSISYRF